MNKINSKHNKQFATQANTLRLGRFQKAFSLLELMATLTIIAVFMGVIAVSVNPSNPERDLRNEALNFKALMKLVVDEAVFSRKEIGIKVYEDKLDFLVFDERSKAWVVISEEGSSSSGLKTYKFPEFLTISLEMEDAEVFLKNEDELESKISSINPLDNFDEIDAEEVEEVITPDIYIFSSGEVTAFEFEFSLEGTDFEEFSESTYIISGNEIGQINCVAEHEEDEKCL